MTNEDLQRELQPDGSSQLGLMIRSHRIEFSVMCSGPLMYIHPVRMGVDMLQPKLHEHTLSQGSE